MCLSEMGQLELQEKAEWWLVLAGWSVGGPEARRVVGGGWGRELST